MEQESAVQEYADDIDQEQPRSGESEAKPSSLAARMRARKEELAQRTTEIFPVPRWGTVLAVELKAIPWERSEQIVEKTQRGSAKGLTQRASAAEVVEATVGFYEVRDDGELDRIEDVYRWSDIVERFADHALPTQVPPAVRDRAALAFLAGDQGTVTLDATYRQWLAGADVGLSQELRRDFETTG